ncbi:isocitrate/isopropylmalate dehydrogenase family protein [Nocardia thraciensis]
MIPGDGIGSEVIRAVLPVLTLLNEARALGIEHDVFGWGADEWLATGVGLPDGALDSLAAEYHAILLGALGDPRIPDMAHGRSILLGLRRGLDLYVNYRPLDLPTGRIDLFRENTQGLYVGVGGTITRRGSVSVAIDECVYTQETVERFVRFGMRRLADTGRTKVTLVHKSNAVPNTGRLWQEVFETEAAAFPQLTAGQEYVDSFCYHLVRDPSQYEGVLAPNLFGDIISDIGAALMGGLGLAASASFCPETGCALFEPVHGSAPDIAGKGIANPVGAAMSLAMALDHMGYGKEAVLLRDSVLRVAATKRATPDLGGCGTTESCMAAVIDLLGAQLCGDADQTDGPATTT